MTTRTDANRRACKNYYLKNKEKRKEYVLARQREIKDAIQAYKIEQGCARCGYDRCARAIHFHHHGDDKEHNISRMVGQGRSLEGIMLEIAKCVCVCANCHAEIHEEEIRSASESCLHDFGDLLDGV